MSKNYGEEVTGGGFPLSTVGDVIEVTYVRKGQPDDYGREVYIFKNEDGEFLDLRGCFDLDKKMKKFGSGAELRIERKEDQPTKSGGTMKIYKIQCVPGTENEGIFEDEPVAEKPAPKLGFAVGDKLLPVQIEDAKKWIAENNLPWSIDNTGTIMPF